MPAKKRPAVRSAKSAKPKRTSRVSARTSAQAPKRPVPAALVDAGERIEMALRRVRTVHDLPRSQAFTAVGNLIHLLTESVAILTRHYEITPLTAPAAPATAAALPPVRAPQVHRPPSASTPRAASATAPVGTPLVKSPNQDPVDPAVGPGPVGAAGVGKTVILQPDGHQAPVGDAAVPDANSATATATDDAGKPAAPAPVATATSPQQPSEKLVDLFAGEQDPTPASKVPPAPTITVPGQVVPVSQAPHALWFVPDFATAEALIRAGNPINVGPIIKGNQVRGAHENGNLVLGSRIVLALYNKDHSISLVGHVAWRGTSTHGRADGGRGTEVHVQLGNDLKVVDGATLPTDLVSSCVPQSGRAPMIAVGPQLRASSQQDPVQAQEWLEKRRRLWSGLVSALNFGGDG